MITTITVSLRGLRDAGVVPQFDEQDLVLYELEFFCHEFGRAVLRVPLTAEDGTTVQLAPDDVRMPQDTAPIGSVRTARFGGGGSVSILVHKVFYDPARNLVRYVRNRSAADMHIISAAEVTKDGAVVGDGASAVTVTRRDGTTFKGPLSLPISHSVITQSRRWLTQRAFYGSAHVSANTAVQRMQYDLLFRRVYRAVERLRFKTPIDFVKAFSRLAIRRIPFVNDRDFANPDRAVDVGDPEIEVSGGGDCEDYAHFFMRLMRLMYATYNTPGAGIAPGSDAFKHAETLAQQYVPLVCICKVKLGGSVQFHSTMLLVPRDHSAHVLSLEVTSGGRSLDLGDHRQRRDYDKWHIGHMFLVDSFMLVDVTDGRDVGDLCIADIAEEAIDY